MRAVIEAFVRGLPLDERARRVLDQTFFDWAHEAAEASRWWGRARVHARSIASVGRALALISVRNLRQIPVAWLAGRLVLFGVLPAFGFVALLPPR